jgi:hypothetical protein
MNIAMQDLFTTDIGILSLVTIGVVVGIAAYLAYYVHKHIAEDEAAHARSLQKIDGRDARS